ncbi:hypothetical protein [Streptacidiphilus sp. PAMC 29251]
MHQRQENRPAQHSSARHSRARRLAAAITVAGLTLGGLLLADGTASAKSGVAVSVSTHSLRVGQSVRVTGTGGDDSARYSYLCVDTRAGSGGWTTVSCNPKPYQSASASVRAARRGTEQFRARLLIRRYLGGPLVLDRVSGTTTVLVH